jgi:2-polyprenyl-3-methyl-5-hydroxy-6-metoxy-1,4-benzoquinol methylase
MAKQTWQDYYYKRISSYGNYENYLRVAMQNSQPFLDEIMKNRLFDGKILELGSGSAKISTILIKKGLEAFALDNDYEILEMAKKYAKEVDVDLSIIKGDIFNLNFPKDNFSLTFNRGVLEHFSDEKIIEAINVALTISPQFIFSVPTKNIKTPDMVKNLNIGEGFGDERYLDVTYWEELIGKTVGVIYRKFGYGSPEKKDSYEDNLFVTYNLIRKNETFKKN